MNFDFGLVEGVPILFFFLEFPAFQRHILECALIPVVESVAKNDSEPYVRASALRCITLMVKIKVLWERSLVELDLMVSFNKL